MTRSLFLGACLLGLCLSAPLSAQEARGSISGRVTDPTGGVVPGASVTIVNTATNETRRTTTNETGYYQVNYLEPSTYIINAEAQGFKKFVRSGLTVNVSAKLDINIALEIGAVAETVEVTAEAPLLETTTASGGRVLDQKQLINLPFSDLNPFALTALAPGMQWTGQPEYRRPFDNGGTSSFNTMGGVGQNEYTIDGMTVTGSGRRVGFVPPADSITEFKLETSNFDASQGFTSGAAINVSSRSGGNRLRGSVFNQHWQQRWNATGHFQRLLWEDQVRKGLITSDTPKQATGRSNNYGFSASGPVFIPKVYNGKDKFFWTLTWNGIRQSKAESTDSVNRTVPSLGMRQGDFSDLLDAPNGVNLYTIYDPRSARYDGKNVVRTPFPGNKGVPVLNPMYDFYVKLYPNPNNVPGLVTPEGFNNYLAFAMPKDEKFHAIVNRYDYAVTENHRVNVRWQWNDRLADEYDWTYETLRGLHSNGLTRINRGGNIGWLWTINPTNILDVGYGISRWEEGSRVFTRTQFGPGDVGLPDYLQQRAGDLQVLPVLDFNNMQDVSGGYPAIGTKLTTQELRLTMNTIKGNHSLKYGWQERRHDFAGSGPGNTSGAFTFRNNWTRRADNDNVSAQHAHEWAGFMMGLPTGMSLDTNDSTYYRTPRRSFFIQDDWRISSRFRISVGLRYEREGGTTERYNRAVSRAFLTDLQQPFTADAKAAYAKNPIPELSPSAFNPVGGTSYLGQNGFETATKGTHIFLPKVGVVFSLNNKTVIRGGWGMYMDTFNVSNDRLDTNGYNQSTSTPISNDNGLTFCCGVGDVSSVAKGRTPINDPFPVRADGTRYNVPLQNYIGPLARVGTSFNSYPWDYRPPLQHRWRIGIQREVMRNLLIDVSYNGAYSYLPVFQRMNYLPGQYWATGMTRDQALDNFLNQNVTSPFNIANMGSIASSDPALYNYMSSQSFFTSKNIRRHQLLRPFPQYTSTLNGTRPGVDWKSVQGYNKYHDLQLLLERRFTAGLTSSFMYTWSAGYEADFYLNEFDTAPSEQLQNAIRPHRIAFTGTYELPWGKGRRFVKEGVWSWLIGNWNGGWVFQYQSGNATGWGNRFYYGDLDQLGEVLQKKSDDIHEWFDSSAVYRGSGAVPDGFVGFEGRSSQQPGSYHVRMFPTRIDAIREDGIMNWDLKVERVFPIKPEMGINARFSVDFLNAFNHTNFGGPNTDPTSGNFGRVTSQRGLPRVIQFNLRVDF